MKKISQDEFHQLCESLDYLAHILNGIGVAQYRMDSQTKEIFWDTAGGGMIDPEMMQRFSEAMESFYFNELMRNMP